MKLEKTIRIAVLVLVSCKYEASCGGGSLDMDKAREFVAGALEHEVGQKPHVTCPESVKEQAGSTFDCTASFGDVKTIVTMKQTDDKGNVTIVSNTGILISSKLEAEITGGLKNQLHGDFKANCGPRVRPSTPGDHFTCDASEVGGSGRSGKIAVTVKDNNGNISWETQDTPSPAPTH